MSEADDQLNAIGVRLRKLAPQVREEFPNDWSACVKILNERKTTYDALPRVDQVTKETISHHIEVAAAFDRIRGQIYKLKLEQMKEGKFFPDEQP
jgi:RNase H-fold protein (predicted Holliday junction resolvase)